MLESYTTLAYLAGVPSGCGSARSSPASPTATSRTSGRSSRRSTCCRGGRAVCGLGLGWFADEHRAYGWPFPPVGRALRAARGRAAAPAAAVGQGHARVRGPRPSHVPEAMCYPRPLQEHVPILVGGNGERRTLRLAAQYADACNIIGEVDVVAPQGRRAARALRRRRPRPRRGRGHPALDDARRARRGGGRAARRAAAATAPQRRSATRRA